MTSSIPRVGPFVGTANTAFASEPRAQQKNGESASRERADLLIEGFVQFDAGRFSVRAQLQAPFTG